jgi:uncharacterized repeat protein (TIGR01451 family)
MKRTLEWTIKNPAIAGFLFFVALALSGPSMALAATSPSLGTAATYGVLTGTFNYNVGLTTIVGTAGQAALGVTAAFPGGGATLAVTGTTQTATPAYTQAGIDQNAALNIGPNALNNQVCTPIGAIVALNAIDIDGVGPLPPGTFTPGCYSSTGTMTITTGTTVTLDGAGTYIFRSGGALNPAANSTVAFAAGTPASTACDVFWAPVAATTIGANSTFIGTIIDDAGITLGNTVSLLGRALAYGAALGNVTADTDTITVPICVVAGGGSGNRQGTITVVKTVINDNGGTKKVVSGETNYFRAPADAYAVTETSDSRYTRTFSGDCNNAQGLVGIAPGDEAVCIVTNNDIGAPVVVPPVPPLIDVVKVPSPLALPGGPGMVKYTYTLSNVGTVPVTDITMVGDSCSPIVLASGDTNSNGKLEVAETWKYTCSRTISETHTNTVVATGWANGISTVDVASATVVVGSPTVRPLIHVTKTPSPFTLPAEGGIVTYTKKVTNPGIVALSNVSLSDDICPRVKYVSGDKNLDSKLDPSETWTYTCKTSLKKTTTNTVIASGEANGFRVRDFAVAHVVVATAPAAPFVPKLPNTGVAPLNADLALPTVVAGLLAASVLLYAIWKKKTI